MDPAPRHGVGVPGDGQVVGGHLGAALRVAFLTLTGPVALQLAPGVPYNPCTCSAVRLTRRPLVPRSRSISFPRVRVGKASDALREHGLHPVRVGGAAVELYTSAAYTTKDLDFVVESSPAAAGAMTDLGFQQHGRVWFEPELEVVVEFPGTALQPATANRIEVQGSEVDLISINEPTKSYEEWRRDSRGWKETAERLLDGADFSASRTRPRHPDEAAVLRRFGLERWRPFAALGGDPHPAVQIRRLRKRAGLSQKELAGKLGVSQQYVQQLEDPNRANPTCVTLRKVADALARTSQRLAAARAQWCAMTALRLVRGLDVVHGHACADGVALA
ncbi:MAG: helix-turn-helix domain-containing protein, partial [Acidobacteriota bacterium]